ncbi:hypothetical protein FE633_06910 [Streptomyces montanus]|uniref:Integral membrane protein n=1 Tax=Streptomyces montanus TaxID=2580423 RepID=A0A5R9FS51_9ACTN|nr:hypothetical protein [Streptomyces montanus]TLS46837.1 hypothetical protein FE633_06910 [Streptomyces montanus]
MEPSGTTGPEGPRRSEDDRPLNAEERAEYERLRRHAHTRHRRLRYAGASVLLLLAFILAPLAVVAAWIDSEITDTDRYVETVAPLAKKPAVQNLVTDRVTDRVVDNIDTKKVTDALADALARNGVPSAIVDQAEALDGVLKTGVTTVVHDVVNKVVTSDEFAQAWEIANRRAHAAVLNVLTGEGGSAVEAKGDAITLNIGTVIDEVKHRLVDAGFDKAADIPDVDKSVVLVQVDKLNEAQDAARLLDILGVWLPVLVVALVALAVGAAPSHRRALMTAGIGVGVMMVVLLVGLAVMRRVYLDSVPSAAQSEGAAAVIYDELVRFLKDSTVTMLVIAVFVVIAAYLYGPGRVARALRSVTVRGTEASGHLLARAGLRTGGTGRWLDRHRGWTTGIVIGLAVLTLFLWNYPTAGSVALVVGLAVVVLLILGVLAAARTAPEPATAAARPPPDTGPSSDTETPS